MIKINDSIFKVDNANYNITSEDLALLKNIAPDTSRKRSRILIHDDETSIPQHMIISFTDSSVIELSTHTFDESFLILDGVGQYILYNDLDKIDIRMCPFGYDGIFYVIIPSNIYHRFFSFTRSVTAVESGWSMFNSSNTKHVNDLKYNNINNLQSFNIYNKILTLPVRPSYSFIDSNIIKLNNDFVKFLSTSFVNDIISKLNSSFQIITHQFELRNVNITESFIVILPYSKFVFTAKDCHFTSLSSSFSIQSKSVTYDLQEFVSLGSITDTIIINNTLNKIGLIKIINHE